MFLTGFLRREKIYWMYLERTMYILHEKLVVLASVGLGGNSLDVNCTKIISNFATNCNFFCFPLLRSKTILGNAHENSEELERARVRAM